MGKENALLYRVKMDIDQNHWMQRDPATIIEVPENCLMDVKEFIRPLELSPFATKSFFPIEFCLSQLNFDS